MGEVNPNLKYGIAEMAQAETWLINVVEDVKRGATLSKEQITYLATYVPTGKHPLVLQRFGEEGSIPVMASDQLREDFMLRRRTGTLPKVGAGVAAAVEAAAAPHPGGPQQLASVAPAVPTAHLQQNQQPQNQDLEGLEIA